MIEDLEDTVAYIDTRLINVEQELDKIYERLSKLENEK